MGKYIIYESPEIRNFQFTINEYIEQGYKPIGNVCVTYHNISTDYTRPDYKIRYSQALIYKKKWYKFWIKE